MGGSILSVAHDLETSGRQIRSALAESQSYLERDGFDYS